MTGSILVVGGAGYIGSHMCKHLSKAGYEPIVLDNLIYGHEQAVKWGPLYKGPMNDSALLSKVFSDYPIEAVMHFAAFCYVGESVTSPAKYYENNVSHTLSLLKGMVEKKVRRFIFSSSCATYGQPIEIPINEEHPQSPISPYGRTKVMVEQILEDYRTAYGLESISLRYFNAAGADRGGDLGEDHRPETHLIPLVLQTALGQRPCVDIFGNDYPTADGTCVRDYIHVEDLTKAHLLALERLLNGLPGGQYNLGNGKGYSVEEVVDVARRVTGRPIATKVTARRAGDPAVLISSSRKAAEELGWHTKFPDLETIVETAWNWHRAHPDGYGDD
ncbi:MAG: UDP-glucose 4-epimerase GalE [Thermodesulfobacteriota bacterium]|nr:UDP-glucose 4-epimerase GalE [Thermodesulfobacteriota bacterium]